MNVKTTEEIVRCSSIVSSIPSIQEMRLNGNEKWVGVEELKEKINLVRKMNPYPGELKLTKEENLRWKFGKIVWNNCLDDLESELFNRAEEQEKGKEA